jgi:hypothetical protein
MLLFDASAYGLDSRNWRQSLTEAHAEIAALQRSLRDAHARTSQLARRCELLERQLARRR